ncbi:hypothetical protein DEO72_LG8g2461 [Vigna unguiculata]|uniref:Uncharacterized protein n=1 Tax=Vigna unguiculata TaxID=3917 RepID=A0A4D6MX17_VIGUN|nr:hypothetical protein DEO72_LG8g2461 [Vigna unguiculata]
MSGPKPARLPPKKSEQRQMYHQISGNITVWSAQSLMSNFNRRNINRFQQNMENRSRANIPRLSETESLKTPILLAWARYRAQKRPNFLAMSLRRTVPRLSETKSLITKPRSPGRAVRSQLRREVLQLSPRQDRLAWARLAEFPHCHTRILPK